MRSRQPGPRASPRFSSSVSRVFAPAPGSPLRQPGPRASPRFSSPSAGSSRKPPVLFLRQPGLRASPRFSSPSAGSSRQPPVLLPVSRVFAQAPGSLPPSAGSSRQPPGSPLRQPGPRASPRFGGYVAQTAGASLTRLGQIIPPSLACYFPPKSPQKPRQITGFVLTLRR
jgi:hypothetical protein